MCHHDPQNTRQFILVGVSVNHSNKIVQMLSAGPLEDLLAHHPYAVIERVEREARVNRRFASLLGGVWQNNIPDDVCKRVQAVQERRGWDGIPAAPAAKSPPKRKHTKRP